MPVESDPFSRASKRAALAVATFGAFMTPFDGSVVNLALPTIGKEFRSDVVALGWIVTAYVLGLTICVIPFGRLADIRGRRLIYVIGVALFTAASAFCGLALSLASLIAARFVQGVAAAMMAGNSIALLTSIFPQEERGKALGIQTAAVYVGLSLGPSVGGFLVEGLGWRSIFYVNVPIGIGVIALALTKVPRDAAHERGAKLDVFGMVVWALVLTLVLLGLTLSEQHGAPFARTLVASGLALLALFIFYETRVDSPVLDVGLFKNIAFACSTLTALLNYSAVFGVSFIMSLYLQVVSGFPPQHAGLIMLAQPVTMAALSPLSGRLSDKIQPRILSSIGMAVVATSIFSLSRLAADAGALTIAARLMLLGVGHAFFSSPNVNATVSSVEKRRYGVAAALLSTFRFTGQAISIAVSTSVLSAYVGGVAVSTAAASRIPVPAFMAGMKIALEILAAICSMGIVTSLVRGKIRTEKADARKIASASGGGSAPPGKIDERT
ncbi:MAG TPA: MFS transporter [Candidatus Binatia bacterium]|jgi:EmrB/QacA subfamily drug resistance transporter